MLDVRTAYLGPSLWRRFAWHCLQRRPPRWFFFQNAFSQAVARFQPGMVLTTGLTPLAKKVLQKARPQIGGLFHYSTDDPWNSGQRAQWFLESLTAYDGVFSTRKANLGEFAALGVKTSHLPFGYDQDLYFWDSNRGIPDSKCEKAKVFLAGGADNDRVILLRALVNAQIDLSLYGDYWERAKSLKPFWQGRADPSQIRKEAVDSMVSLLLVRRANRDGSAMRSFEIPACGACCVAENTEEHREMFGPDGEAVLYFKTPEELVRRVKEAFGNPELRAKLRANAHRVITGKPNTYVDRLKAILEKMSETKD
ncbi:hypothetical protein EBX31_07720 [bacterium]|nr:hypothetical protein [bacterium]